MKQLDNEEVVSDLVRVEAVLVERCRGMGFSTVGMGKKMGRDGKRDEGGILILYILDASPDFVDCGNEESRGWTGTVGWGGEGNVRYEDVIDQGGGGWVVE